MWCLLLKLSKHDDQRIDRRLQMSSKTLFVAQCTSGRLEISSAENNSGIDEWLFRRVKWRTPVSEADNDGTFAQCELWTSDNGGSMHVPPSGRLGGRSSFGSCSPPQLKGHKGPCCVGRWRFSAVIMGFIQEEIQSSQQDHRIRGRLTSAPISRTGTRTAPRWYWLRQHWLICLCWTLDDVSHFWPVGGCAHLTQLSCLFYANMLLCQQ